VAKSREFVKSAVVLIVKMKITIIITLVLALFLGGCIVYSPPDPDGPDFYRPAIPPYHPQPQTVVVRAELVHSDIEWVLWEYYDWDYDVVYDLHNRYKYTDDEVALILFLAYHGHCEPIRIVQWRQSGIPWMTITTYNLKLQPDVFFVPISPAYKFGPPYGNAYGRYWKNPRTVVLTDSEMISLVYLKTTCLAYNASPVEVIKLHEQGRDFNQIIWVHRSEGRHIKTVHGRDVREPPERVRIKPVKPYKPGRDVRPNLKDGREDKPGNKVKLKPDPKPSGNSDNKDNGNKGGNSGKSDDKGDKGNSDNKGGGKGKN
jgi:hypothetical protein